MNESNTTDLLTAGANVATAFLTLLLFIAALWAGFVAKKTMEASQRASVAAEKANDQARRDSIEQTRPYVYVEIVPGLAGEICFDLKIRNAGKSSARELTLEYSSWPTPIDDVSKSAKTLFETPRTLPPGCGIRTMWRLIGNFTDGTTEAGLGDAGTITVRYTSDDPSRPVYVETFDFDVKAAGLWPVPDTGPNPRGLSERDLSFLQLGQAIARHIGEISR